jgi:hypothetical protein
MLSGTVNACIFTRCKSNLGPEPMTALTPVCEIGLKQLYKQGNKSARFAFSTFTFIVNGTVSRVSHYTCMVFVAKETEK